MSAPSIPSSVPANRLSFLTTRDLETNDGMEVLSICYLSDSEEWVVESKAERELVLAQNPEAKFFKD